MLRCSSAMCGLFLSVSQGYNDGLTTLPLADYEPQLSPQAAQAAEFDDYELETVTKQIFEEGLGLAGVSLLKQGVQGLVRAPSPPLRNRCACRCCTSPWSHSISTRWWLHSTVRAPPACAVQHVLPCPCTGSDTGCCGGGAGGGRGAP